MRSGGIWEEHTCEFENQFIELIFDVTVILSLSTSFQLEIALESCEHSVYKIKFSVSNSVPIL